MSTAVASVVETASSQMMAVENLEAWYGESKALHGVTFAIDKGTVVSLLGRNGAGKSTTLRCAMGLIKRRSGSIVVGDKQTISLRSDRIARLGLALCPEDRAIFSSLNVTENLLLPPVVAPGGLDLDTIYALFPNLLERRNSPGTKLSGGEQQMLAIARILRTGAKLIMLDEPTEGLAPVIVKQIGKVLHELKRLGFTILLVEQNLSFVEHLADHHFVMEHGEIVDSLSGSEFRKSSDRVRKYLTV